MGGVQLIVLRMSLPQDRQIRVSTFPESEETALSFERLLPSSARSVRTGQS
jgi:hypothetical protein